MENTKVALIPAYQPTETLVALVRELRAEGYTVVAVDDGSGPDYAAVFDSARQSGAAVVSYTPNRGKGRALKTGLEYIAAHPDIGDVIVTLDSDGQHTVADTGRVSDAAMEDGAALVLGVRSFGKGTPARSRFGNACTRAVYRLSTGHAVSDTQTGLRAFGRELLPFMSSVEGERYEYEMNVLLECPKKGIAMKQVPIATVYSDNNRGSHFRTLSDSALIYRDILKFAASSFLGFLVDYASYSLLAALLSPLGNGFGVPAANVTARVISASVNFAVNKRFVFKNKDSVVKTGAQYFVLAACILAGNTVLLSFLVNGLSWNKYLSKLITEVTFFTLSYLAQHFIIFRKKKTDPAKTAASAAAAASAETTASAAGSAASKERL